MSQAPYTDFTYADFPYHSNNLLSLNHWNDDPTGATVATTGNAFKQRIQEIIYPDAKYNVQDKLWTNSGQYYSCDNV